MDDNNRYSDADLAEFKEIIQKKIDYAVEDLGLIKSAFKNDSNNGTDDTSPTFKAFEEGSETMSKEANVALAIRQEKFIRDLKNAIHKINRGQIEVDLTHKGIDPMVHTIQRITKQLVAAFIMVALIVGSSLFIISEKFVEFEFSSLDISDSFKFGK